jgi:Fe-S-cluster-containing dehydrogenase component
MEECIACGSCMLACARTRYHSFSLDKSAITIRTAGGFRSSVIADLCLACAEPACAAVCPSRALVPRPGGGVIVKQDRCLGCGRCAEECAVRGIRFNAELGYPIVCAHCGACARYCPHGCLELEEVK